MDRLGERLLVFDSASSSSLELLKFKEDFGTRPEFEALVRARIQALQAVRHPLVSIAKSIERSEEAGGLVLSSPHVVGRRLSEIVANARGPAFALEFIRQVSPALSTLQQVAPGTAHGIFNADRLVVTREGRLVIVEAVLGPAIQSLHFSASRLRSDLGLALPEIAVPIPLDQRLDVVQLGFLALSLVLGRRLDPSDYRARVPGLLDEFGAAAPAAVSWLQPWLEHALQMTERPFECALDAAEAALALRAPGESSTTVGMAQPGFQAPPDAPDRPDKKDSKAETPITNALPAQAQLGPHSRINVALRTPEPAQVQPQAEAKPQAFVTPPARVAPPVQVTTPVQVATPVHVVSQEVPRPSAPKEETMASVAAPVAPVRRTAVVAQSRFGAVHFVAAGLAVVAAVEGFVIARLMAAPAPMAAVSVAPPVIAAPVYTPPAPVTVEAVAPAPPAPVAPPAVAAADSVPMEQTQTAKPAAAGKFGGVRVTSSIELQVFENGTLLGSSSGPLALTEGNHTLDLVSEPLAYRSKQTVAIKPGQMAAVQISLPQGKVNINAAPWASVWIDGNAAGDTPLANLSLPIGAHEVLFRHPQLGDQRLTAVVKAEGVTRVSATFQR